MRKIDRKRRVLSVVSGAILALSLLGAGYFSARLVYCQNLMTATARRLVEGKQGDKAKILSCLDFVSDLDTAGIANKRRAIRGTLARKLWASFYSIPPVNLIPPDIVLNHHLAFRGPCGSKSKLLVALLRPLGYPCWLLNLKSHTLVEVRVGNVTTPLDPTYNLYFTTREGGFVDTATVAANPDMLVKANETLKIKYPTDDPSYSYNSIWRLNMFFYLQPYFLFIFTCLLLGILSATCFWACQFRKRNLEPS